LLTNSAVAHGGKPPDFTNNLLNAAGRIIFEIDSGFKVALTPCLVNNPAEAVNDADIALSQELWDAGELIKLYHAHRRLTALIDLTENIRAVCASSGKDILAAEGQLGELKKQASKQILSIFGASRGGKPMISNYLRQAAEAARPLRQVSAKSWTTASASTAIAEEILFELRHIYQSLVYRIGNQKIYSQNRSVMIENRLAFNTQSKISSSDLAGLAGDFLKENKTGGSLKNRPIKKHGLNS
jgi:hypothetical protein